MSEETDSEKKTPVSKTFDMKYRISKRISWKIVKGWIFSFIEIVFIAGIILVFIILFLAILSNSLSGYFPKEVGKPLTIDVLKGIIQVDGILIGLNGLVYAQLLWSINSLQNTISQGFFENKIDKTQMTNSLKKLQSERRILILALLFVTILYLCSIYYALAHIAWTESWVSDKVVIYSFMYMPTLLLFSATIISMVIASTRKLTIIETEDEKVT